MQRILVIRLDFLGDMVCTTPLLHAIKQRWPEAELHVLGNKYNKAVLAGNPDIDVLHTYVYSKQHERNEHHGRICALWQRLRLIRRLRQLKFDLIVIPNGGMNKNSIQFARQLGSKDLRYHSSDTEFDDRNPLHVTQRPMEHEALSGFRLLPELSAVTIDDLRLHVYPDLQLQMAWQQRLGERDKPRIGLFISNKSPVRRWPETSWCDVIASLQEKNKLIVFYDAAEPADISRYSALGALCVAPPSVMDLVAAMSSLDLVISADSAPVHLASALGIPLVALFEDRPEKYLRWYPLGVPYRLLHAGASVSEITSLQVNEAVLSLLEPVSDDNVENNVQ